MSHKTYTTSTLKTAFTQAAKSEFVKVNDLNSAFNVFYDNYANKGMSVEDAYRTARSGAKALDDETKRFLKVLKSIDARSSAKPKKGKPTTAKAVREAIDETVKNMTEARRDAKAVELAILQIARNARKIGRESGSQPVIDAAQAVADFSDEAVRRIGEMDADIREARKAGREGDLGAVESALEDTEATLDLLEVLRTEAEEAFEVTEEVAKKAAEDEKAQKETQAIQKIDTDSKEATEKITEIVERVAEKVGDYKVACVSVGFIDNGTDDTDDESKIKDSTPDGLLAKVNKVLSDATKARDKVVKAVSDEDKSRAEADGGVVAAAYETAKKIELELDDRIRRVDTAQKLEVAQESRSEKETAKAKKRAEEEPKFLDQWWVRAIAVVALFTLALLFLPHPYKAVLSLAAIPVGIVVASPVWKLKIGRLVFWVYTGLVSLLVGILFVVPMIELAPDGISGNLPGEVTPTPEPEPTVERTFVPVPTLPVETPESTETPES